MNTLAEWVFDEFINNGTNDSYESALNEFLTENPESDEEEFNDCWEGGEDYYSLELDGMKLELGYLGGCLLVWVIYSPYLTRASVCSPCCPNAGDLNNQSD